MKKILLSLVMCGIVLFATVLQVSAEPDLTIDFNKRYTDISEFEDVDDPYLDLDKQAESRAQKRNVYAIVLIVCLVVAIVVFVYTLRKVPNEAAFEAKEKKKLRGVEHKDEKASEDATSIKDEEKTL